MPSSDSVSSQKALKRKWLQQRGIVPSSTPGSRGIDTSQQLEPSGAPAAADVEQSLSNITDDTWVLKVCLAEIDHAADGDYDADPSALEGLRAVLRQGIKRAGRRKDIREFLQQLEYRLQAASASSSSSALPSDQSGQDQEDGWDLDLDVNAPQRSAQEDDSGGLSIYLQPSLVDVASSLIISKQYHKLSALVEQPELATQLEESKEELLRLLLSSAETARDVSDMAQEGLLPLLSPAGRKGRAWSSASGGQTTTAAAWYGKILQELHSRRTSNPSVMLAVIAALHKTGALESKTPAADRIRSLQHEVELEDLLSLAPAGATAHLGAGRSAAASLQDPAGVQQLLDSIVSAAPSDGLSETCATALFPLLHRFAASAGSEQQSQDVVQKHLITLCLSLVDAQPGQQDAARLARGAALLDQSSGLESQIGRQAYAGLLLTAAYAPQAVTQSNMFKVASMLRNFGGTSSASEQPSGFAAALSSAMTGNATEETLSAEAIFSLTQKTLPDASSYSSAIGEAATILEFLVQLDKWTPDATAAWLASCTEAPVKSAWIRKTCTGGRAAAQDAGAWTDLLQTMLGGTGSRAIYPLKDSEVVAVVLQACYEAGRESSFRYVSIHASVTDTVFF